MAISQTASGGNTNSAAATTLTITPGTAPTNGNVAVLILNTSAAISALTVKDSNNVALTAGPVQGNLRLFYYTVTGSPTGYTASWTTSVQCSMAVQEYSGVGAVNTNFAANIASGSSASDSIVVAITAVNNWIVAGLGSANTLTTSVGNQRQQVTASTARVTLQDNTSASVGNVTNTATLTSAAWTAVAIELGGTGSARDAQELVLVVKQPTTANALVAQDVELVITKPTTANARVEQEVLLAVVSNNLLLKVHVKRFITQRRKKPRLKKHWGHFQNAALLASEPYTPIIEKGVKRVVKHREPKHVRRIGHFLNHALFVATPFANRRQPFVFVSC